MGTQRLTPATTAAMPPLLCAYYGYQLATGDIIFRVLSVIVVAALTAVAIGQHSEQPLHRGGLR